MLNVTCIAFGPTVQKFVEMTSWDLLKLLLVIEILLVTVPFLVLFRLFVPSRSHHGHGSSYDLINTGDHRSMPAKELQ
jgi:hypothetical protein